ncbi:unnamed protein product, partial [Mesorhabditis belari]
RQIDRISLRAVGGEAELQKFLHNLSGQQAADYRLFFEKGKWGRYKGSFGFCVTRKVPCREEDLAFRVSSDKTGCQGCSKTDPPGYAGFNKDLIENQADGCLTRKLTCHQPNYVVYRATSGTVSQADPILVLDCNKDSKWVTREEKWRVESVDCHNSTEPKKPKSVCKLEKITGPCK